MQCSRQRGRAGAQRRALSRRQPEIPRLPVPSTSIFEGAPLGAPSVRDKRVAIFRAAQGFFLELAGTGVALCALASARRRHTIYVRACRWHSSTARAPPRYCERVSRSTISRSLAMKQPSAWVTSSEPTASHDHIRTGTIGDAASTSTTAACALREALPDSVPGTRFSVAAFAVASWRRQHAHAPARADKRVQNGWSSGIWPPIDNDSRHDKLAAC